MISPLEKISLEKLFQQPIMFDANIFMVGIEERGKNPNSSFSNIKELFMIPIFESFSQIIIHQKVYTELDVEARKFVDTYIEKMYLLYLKMACMELTRNIR